VDDVLAADICSELSFNRTYDLGLYLGVPIHTGCSSRQAYSFLIDKIRKKLSSWKTNTFSFASRVTLAQTSIMSIPNHVMQTQLIPISVCDEINCVCKKFI
jgi:hypothetical protein